MSYIDFAQLAYAQAQLSQLQGLQAQFQQQANAQRQQAILADMLFQTERRARQLTAVAADDRLVAAMFAQEWMASVRGVAPEHFVQVDHKRAWVAAVGRLQQLQAPMSDPVAATTAQQVWAASTEARSIHQELGGIADPEAQLATLGRQFAELEDQKRRALILAASCGGGAIGGPIALVLIAGIVNSVMTATRSRSEVDSNCVGTLGTLLFLVLIVAAGIYFSRWSDRSSRAQRASGEYHRVGGAVTRLRTFTADPNRGGVLERFGKEHPAYWRPLPNVDDMAPLSSGPASVVERQTVVVRCKYCRALTPVDDKTCHNCGAASFS